MLVTTPDIEQMLLPDEAAHFLNISTYKLGRLRRDNRIVGERVGKSNVYVYRLSDLRQANLTPKRRGPRPKNIVQ